MYFVSQPIVTNGLVLHLDAGNSLSYTSGSITWRDLSGNSSNGTINGVITSSTDNGGTFALSGTGTSITVNTVSNYRSLSFFLYKTDSGSAVNKYIIDARPTFNGYWQNLGTAGWTNFYLNGKPISNSDFSLIPTNQWFHIYMDAGANYTSSIVFMARFNNAESMGGKLGQLSMYNRALNPNEIQQNFNALRGRFGI